MDEGTDSRYFMGDRQMEDGTASRHSMGKRESWETRETSSYKSAPSTTRKAVSFDVKGIEEMHYTSSHRSEDSTPKTDDPDLNFNFPAWMRPEEDDSTPRRGDSDLNFDFRARPKEEAESPIVAARQKAVTWDWSMPSDQLSYDSSNDLSGCEAVERRLSRAASMQEGGPIRTQASLRRNMGQRKGHSMRIGTKSARSLGYFGRKPRSMELPSPELGKQAVNEVCQEDANLEAHREERSKDSEIRRLLRDALAEDRVCKLLEEGDYQSIVDAMKFFKFAKDETVIRQGQEGSHFFVIHEGSFMVSMDGQVVNTMTQGMSFGGLALIYKNPRTATVTATAPSAVWGVSSEVFHDLVRERTQKHIKDNKPYIDSIWLFNGLGARQRDRVSESLFVEQVPAGARVITEGEQATAIYYVKTGELRAVKGATIEANGNLAGGEQVATMCPNSIFGERAVLYDAPRASTVVANTECELLCMSVLRLKEIFGSDLAASLERQIMLSSLDRSPVFAQFDHSHKTSLIKAMEIKRFEPQQKLEDCFWVMVVLEGMLTGMFDGFQVDFARGDWYENGLDGEVGARHHGSTGGTEVLKEIVVGESGARVGILTKEGLASALTASKQQIDSEEAMNYARKIALVKKVPIFRHLSEEQTDSLVRAIVLTKYNKGRKIVSQGEIGTSFYVIASGEVTISINGQQIRTLAKNAYFGERTLLFEERRTASVEVTSTECEVWSLDKSACAQIMKGRMFQELVNRIRLQDTKVSLRDLRHMKVIGSGGFGVVRLVQHFQTGMRYALKRCKKVDGAVPSEIKYECELLAENDHPFIMHTVKTFETARSVYMLTELITGGDVYAAIRKLPEVLSAEQAQFYTGSLVLVLEALFDRNIVYRDLKPENVMLDAQGYIKLIDFGIAKKLPEADLRTFTVIGTPHYMAPEIMRGHGYTTSVDLWSLGVMLYEFVIGFLPFADEKSNPTEVCAAVLTSQLKFPKVYTDKWGTKLIEGLLNRNPANRIGAGVDGYEDIKEQPYFILGNGQGTESLFNMIMGRQLDAPYVADNETYCGPDDDDVDELSDMGELFQDTDPTFGRLLELVESCVCQRFCARGQYRAL